MRLSAIVVGAVLVLTALLVGWAYVHRASWYHQDFAQAFQERIEHELIPGQTAEVSKKSVVVREVGEGQRLVCGTVHIRGGERPAGTFRYAVQFWPTLFSGGGTDIASPRVAGADDLQRDQPVC